MSNSLGQTPDAAPRGSLLAILGVAFGVAAGVGGAIGGGILRTPGVVAGHLPSSGWMIGIWVFASLYCLLVANVLIELATMMPRAGGPYVFIRRALGEFWGFVFGWADWALQTSAVAFLGIACGEYAVQLWPALPASAVVVAIVTVVVLVALNLIGLRLGSGMQQAFSVAKVLGFLGVACLCLIAPAPVASSTGAAAETANPLAVVTLAAFFLSWQLVQETFGGYENPVYFSEENRDASRSIPRAIFFSVLITAAVYLLIIVAITHVLTPEEISGSKLALADAAAATIGESSGRWVTALAVISLLGILNVNILVAPRILFAIGRDGLFTGRAASVNAGGAPAVATLFTTGVVMLLALTGSFELLYTITAFLGVTLAIGNITSFFVLRRREPQATRPYRSRGYPWLPALALLLAGSLWLGSLYANPRSAIYGLAAVAIAYPVYRFTVRRRAARLPVATPVDAVVRPEG